MLLTIAKPGETNSIKKINGRDDCRRFLERLGFVEGEEVTVISEMAGNMVVGVKNSRVALSKNLTNRIIV